MPLNTFVKNSRRLFAAVFLLALAGRLSSAAGQPDVLVSEHALSFEERQSEPLARWTEVLAKPRTLRAHFLRVDLRSPRYEVFTLLARDPDGPGPAEGALEKPEQLFEREGAVAAVNANAFRALPDAMGRRDTNWFEGKPVDIVGLAVCDGAVRSGPFPGRTGFWLDSRRRPHVGDPGKDDRPKQGVSDWSGRLVANGKILAPTEGPIHPRTVAGVDDSGGWLLLCVIDGRQAGHSEGVSLHEAADLMRRHGCRDAVNLDGGGSAVMLVAGEDGGKPIVVNRPSDGKTRPIPVMLGVRKTKNAK